MSLDVGVVQISYLPRPDEPVYSFLWHIVQDSIDEAWGGGWPGNAFVEMPRRRMLNKARLYARNVGLSSDDLHKILEWIRNLPWQGNYIMLHLSY